MRVFHRPSSFEVEGQRGARGNSPTDFGGKLGVTERTFDHGRSVFCPRYQASGDRKLEALRQVSDPTRVGFDPFPVHGLVKKQGD